MKKSIKSFLTVSIIALLLSSCVMKKKFTELEMSKNELQENYLKLQSKSTNQTGELKKLNVKYDALLADYNELSDKKKRGENLSQQQKMKIEGDLKVKMSELEDSNKKIKDLEASLNAQKTSMNLLKSKIQDAFKVLNNENLTVERRGDKVYVSLPEDLLFKSGSAKVGTGGKDALKKFADVMATQTDIEIVVEGHTDSIPLNGSTIKDKWD